MNKRTLKALHGSVRKWIKIATWKDADKGTKNCPLCVEFFHESFGCGKCPVRNKTNRSGCLGTPYYDFRESAYAELGDNWIHGHRVAGPKSQAAAEKMALFLIDLLPEEEKARYYE